MTTNNHSLHLAASGKAAFADRRARFSGIVSATVLILATLLPATGRAGNDNPGVLPPNSRPHGVEYANWITPWLNWFATYQEGDCGSNQDGKVFFIPHTYLDSPIHRVELHCTVPTGTMIMANGGGGVSWAEAGETEAELRQSVIDTLPIFRNVRITIDGRAVKNIDQYLFVSDPFDLVLPPGNGFGGTPGTWRAVAGGWHVILPPLPPGEHTIVVHDEIDEALFGGPNAAEVVAHITVVPGKK